MKRIAVIFLLLVFETNGSSQNLWYAQGESAFNSGDNQGAINSFTAGIGEYPGNAGLYIIRGLIYAKMGNYQQAIKDYDRAIELEPKSLFYRSKATPYTDPGIYKQKLEDYDRAIKIYPKSLAFYLRGNANTALNNYKQAILDYSDAIKSYSKNIEAYVDRGQIHSRLGNKVQAQRDWMAAVNLAYKDAQRLFKEKGVKR